MDISIITPSYNGLGTLPLATASVADQDGVSAEHIVVDGDSSDGTGPWLPQQPGLRWVSEPDRGMYDAINKGMLMACGEVMGYLNCDEQYLPGALATVTEAFRSHPEIDLIYGDMLVIDSAGQFLAFRKSHPLRWAFVAATHLYVPSCALFWRKRLVDDGLAFDVRWRIQGDADFVIRVLKAGYRTLHLRRYLAAFSLSSSNLGATVGARSEMLAARREAPWWIRHGRWIWSGMRLVEKWVYGSYLQHCPFDYEIYTKDAPVRRRRFEVLRASSRWPTNKSQKME